MERGTAGLQALDVLRKHLPFSRMAARALEELAANLSETFFAQGEIVLQPEHGLPDTLYIIKQGRIRGAAPGNGELPAADMRELTDGEALPIRALLERRAVTLSYRATEDTFCYQLPASAFHRLLESSPEFLEFCLSRLQALVQAVEHSARLRTAENVVSQLPLTTPLEAFVRRTPVRCAPDTPLLQAFQIMTRERVGSIVATDEAGRPLGILTLRDVLPRVLLAGVPLDTPMRQVMTHPVRRLAPDAPAWHAALEMARHSIGHLCVVDGERLVGVVSERDLFAMQRARLVPITRAILDAPTLSALQSAVEGIGALVDQLLAQGLSASALVEIITTLNDHTTRRAIELCQQQHEAEHGPLACAFTWLAFGSEGRCEQTLKTDQDNGMLLLLQPGQSADDARAAMLPLAQRINKALEACGFPLCPGKIMAGNPECCLSGEEWRVRFSRWVEQGAPQHLLNAAIFFDLRWLYGDAQPVEALRAWLGDVVPRNPRFLHQLAEESVQVRPPLSWLDSIVVTRGGAHPNTIDLKGQGVAPFVNAGRIYALAEGLAVTHTPRRLRGAAERGHLPSDEVEGWVAAWGYLQSLRMQQHRRQAAQNLPRTNHVDPDSLNPVEQQLLKEVLRQARHLQSRLALDYAV